jgi:uncharacterized protein
VPVRTVLITGASSGIGEAFANVFASEGFDLVLAARREDRLRAVAARLAQQYGRRVEVVVVDLSRPEAAAELCAEIASRGMAIDALVNNAGYGIPGLFTDSTWARHQAMLHVMVTGLAELTHRLLPGMTAQGYGRIVNVASLAGLVPPTAGYTLYSASKSFVIGFSEALSHEVSRSGVHVTAVCPGFTFSEFHEVTGTRQEVNRLPGWMWMDAMTVARQGFEAVMNGTAVYVNGRANRAIAASVRYAPRWLLKVVTRRASEAYFRAR